LRTSVTMMSAAAINLLAEHTTELLATAAVAALLVIIAYGVTYIMMPKSPSTKAKADVDLLAEYGRVWCLHQFVPFVDKLVLGSYGQAMDNRMLVPWEKGPADWMIRLPLIVASFIFPSPWLLMLAHLANVISWATWMPAVWDHMVWAALLEVTFVLAALAGGGRERVAQRFIPAARMELVLLYWSAAFWKLTTSWYAVRTSCAPVLLSELLAGIFSSDVLPAGSLAANTFLKIAPVFVAALEFAVAAALMLRPPAGLVLALGFHQTINLMPMTYAGGFSISMCCRFPLIVPGLVTKALGPSDSLLVPSSMVVAVGAAMFAIHKGVDSACVLYLVLALLYFRGLMSGHYVKGGKGGQGGAAWLSSIAIIIGFVYGFMTPILGLQAMAASTMYGNLKQWGGGNHLLVPTGLLQEHFLTASTPSWASDAFGGGLLRVDATNSSVLQRLAPAEATPQLPEHARQLLLGVGATGRYFELYAARNYWDRDHDFESSALHNRGSDAVRLDDPPYVQPAYEMRRVLKLARAKGEVFYLKYTNVPWLGHPKDYASYTGKQVVLEENPATGSRTCTVEGLSCADSEIALLPPPPRWLTSLLHPYPMPLLPGDEKDVHCST